MFAELLKLLNMLCGVSGDIVICLEDVIKHEPVYRSIDEWRWGPT